MKSLLFILMILAARPIQADDWNDLVQDCTGGSKKIYKSIQVKEKGFRWGHVFSGLSSSSYTTVELTVAKPNGQPQKFTACEFLLSEDVDATYITIHDCNPNGSEKSPYIICSIQDDGVVLQSPKKSNGPRAPGSKDTGGGSKDSSKARGINQ